MLKAQTIASITDEKRMQRLKTGIADVDTVLGGGILPGGVLLLAGQPGIGKST